MIALIQRVSRAEVKIEGNVKADIKHGLLVLLGIETADDNSDIEWLTSKLVNLRIFGDENGLMNRSMLDINGEVLVISQFTLHANTKKGNRPSFIKAARPEVAIPLYEKFISALSSKVSNEVKSGEFGADMKVDLCNDGPVTIYIDTKNKK